MTEPKMELYNYKYSIFLIAARLSNPSFNKLINDVEFGCFSNLAV